MGEEYFYGATLVGASAAITWDPESKEDYPTNFKLIIKQLLLGREAKENEYNVVQVEAATQRDPIKIPIAVLKVGETRAVATDLEFPEAPVTFKLIEGTGPVHIHGQHTPGSMVEFEEMDDEMEDEMVSDEEGEEDEVMKKKLKLENNNTAKSAGKAPVSGKNIQKNKK